MENFDLSYLHRLMMYKLTGIISKEEDRELEQLIQADPAVQQLWEKMQQEHTQQQIEAKFKEYDAEWVSASDITSRPQKKRLTILRIASKLAIAAAVLTCIGTGIYFLTIDKQHSKEYAVNSKATSKYKKAVVLTLSGGQAIDLSQQQDNISVEGAQLANANKKLSYTVNPKAGDSAWADRMNRLTVPIGLDYHVVLADGSEIWLNSATDLQFPFRFKSNSRDISVHGEAYLKVANDASRPFLVHTPNGTIRVLGTEFNVNSYDSTTVMVALVKGAVRFNAGGKEVNLKPGKEAIYKVNKGIQVQTFDEEILAWRKGHYHFYEASLPEITAVIPRWFGIPVKMDNPSLGKERFTGIMNRNVPIDVFLTNIKFTMNIDYYFDKDSILHFK